MPTVGGKHFSYTEEGMKAAEKESKKTGNPVQSKKKKKKKLKSDHAVAYAGSY